MIPCVILVENGIVERNILCDDGEHAEKIFIHYWQKNDPNFSNYSEDDISNIVSDGYIECGNGSICLSWAMTEEEWIGV